jgi:hypothetical protein
VCPFQEQVANLTTLLDRAGGDRFNDEDPALYGMGVQPILRFQALYLR